MEKILVVEDDPQMLRSLARLLLDRGFEVVTAASGMAAIEAAQGNDISLVITDVRMPGMDGLQALGELGAYQPHARKVVITGYAGDDAPLRAIHLSVDDYLMKPFSPDDLLKSVDAALARYRSEREKRTAAAAVAPGYDALVSVAESIGERFPGSAGRAGRMAAWCEKLARSAGMNAAQVERVRRLALIHDLGYASAPDSDLSSSDRTSHADIAAAILSRVPGQDSLAGIIRVHHAGVPERAIPVEAEILAIVEDFEALSSSSGLKPGEAMGRLSAGETGRYDPDLLDAFTRALATSGRAEPASKTRETLLHLAQTYTLIGETDTAAAALEKLQSDKTPDDEFRFRFYIASTRNLIRQKRFAEAEREGNRALETAVSSKLGPRALSQSFLEIALARLFLSNHEKVETLLGKARTFFEKSGDMLGLARAELYSALFHAASGKTDEARSHFAACARAAEGDGIENFWGGESFALALCSDPSLFNPPRQKESGLRIHSLGPVRVYRDGEPIHEEEWKSKKAKILLVYLLLNMDRAVSEEKLCDLFWPQGDPERSRKNLHHIVYVLRRVLEPSLKDGNQSSFIKSRHNTYQFEKSSNHWWDVSAFRKELEEIREAFRSGEHAKAAANVRQLERLYAGDLLEDNLDETWCDFDREKMKEAYLEALAGAASHHEQRKEYEPALEFAGKALSLDPLREKSAYRYISLLLKAGQRSDAVRKYQAWCEQLKRELDIDPSPEFAALYRDMTSI